MQKHSPFAAVVVATLTSLIGLSVAMLACGPAPSLPPPRDLGTDAADAQPLPDLAPAVVCAEPCAWPTRAEDWPLLCGGRPSRCYVPTGQQTGCCQ